MPSQAALERGSAVAQGIIDSHMQSNAGAYPETVAVRADTASFSTVSPRAISHVHVIATLLSIRIIHQALQSDDRSFVWQHIVIWNVITWRNWCAGKFVGPGRDQNQGRERSYCAIHGRRTTHPRRHGSHCKVCAASALTIHTPAPRSLKSYGAMRHMAQHGVICQPSERGPYILQACWFADCGKDS